MKTFKDFLLEELKPREEDEADRMRESGHSFYRDKFLSQHPKAESAFRNSSESVKYRARFSAPLEEKSSEPHGDVVSFLQSHGYHHTKEDYKAGVANETKMVGDPERGIPLREKVVQHKIGGLLEKHNASDEIKKAFVNDTFRTGAKTKDWDLILTGNHRDIYGGSTGRGWTSCAQMRRGENGYNGPASKHTKDEINGHTHMVYLVPKGGNVDTDAVARMSFKHHTGLLTGHQTLLPEDRVYGSPPKGFEDAARKVVSDHFDVRDDEIYKKNDSVYNDNGRAFSVKASNLTADQVDLAWKSIDKKNSQAKGAIFKMVSPDQKYKAKTLNDFAKGISSIRKAADESDTTGDFGKVVRTVKDSPNWVPDDVKYHAAENPHLKSALEHAASKFDVSKESHVAPILGISRYGNAHITDEFRWKISTAINNRGAKNFDEWNSMRMMKETGSVSFPSNQVPIAHDHEMGPYPMDHLVKQASDAGVLHTHHGENADRLFSSMYISSLNAKKGKKRTGNMYDQAVHYENEGVSGMSQIVDSIANRIKEKPYVGYNTGLNTTEHLAARLHNMKPATRQRMASAWGMDHKQIMKEGRAGVKYMKDQEERVKALRQEKEEQV